MEYNKPLVVAKIHPHRHSSTDIHSDQGIMTCLDSTMYKHPKYVLVTPKSTSTQTKYIKNTLEVKTMETQQKLTQENSQTSTYSLADSLAKLSPLLAKDLDLTKPEALSFLTSLGFSQKKNPEIWYSKTLKVYLVTTKEKLSRQSLGSCRLGVFCGMAGT